MHFPTPLLFRSLRPAILALNDQPLLCGCDDAAPCSDCEPPSEVPTLAAPAP
jgi:hypothetical protein